MKNKKILIGCLVFIVGMILTVFGLWFSFKNEAELPNKKPNEQENNGPNDSDNDQDDIDLSIKKENDLYTVLSEMYTSNVYLELPKDETYNFYYLTLAEYKRRGYDLALVNINCPDYAEVAHFGIEIPDSPYPITVNPETCRWDEAHIK